MDTVDAGVVRAFEPRLDPDGWHCRGRLPNTGRITRHNGATRQCGARLEWRGQAFCGRCGGLIAWDGEAVYNGVALRHLDRLEIAP